MCERCQSAGEKLDKFLKDLVEEFPGTTVRHEGKDYPVSRVHHVFVALNTAAELYLREEFDFLREKLEQDKLLNMPLDNAA